MYGQGQRTRHRRTPVWCVGGCLKVRLNPHPYDKLPIVYSPDLLIGKNTENIALFDWYSISKRKRLDTVALSFLANYTCRRNDGCAGSSALCAF